ncbi:esterase family protein [Paractinoplanes brasiliensis]|uniref:Esterase/lipase superfamily enzyme n=1 Tax=Paractinoplanes brasiliensis TaxID=52695 RepID=A0A4R6J8K6_9ACTN|nr:alpha/beta hydrolase-fold protein [Actinoplanes brasiliensis]TDO31792.1 esterase/lipase superfamily enzyme [Actinoplanes brasiliensis]GID30611.1 esterase [Actinoplanes brasiliensis]
MRLYSVDLEQGTVAVYGHWGRPLLVFPTEKGDAWEWAHNGMVGEAGSLIEAGRVKLYCVDSFDAGTWSAHHLPLEERAINHGAYESWILDRVVPHIRDDSGHDTEIATAGCSLGAYHALNLAFRHSDVFPLALCFSGNYDPGTWNAWGERGDAVYFNNPADYVANLHGDHLERLRERLSILLVCGQGRWEDTTGALASTPRMAHLLRHKGIRHELDMWGADTPHDWPSWRAQLIKHLPRFC